MQAVNKVARPGQKLAAKVLIFQAIIGLVVTVIMFAIAGKTNALYVLAGAAICWLPSAVFAFFAFRHAGASKNELVLRSFRKGAALKLLITIFLFAVIFKQFQADLVPLIVGYIATLVAQWPAIVIFNRGD